MNSNLYEDVEFFSENKEPSKDDIKDRRSLEDIVLSKVKEICGATIVSSRENVARNIAPFTAYGFAKKSLTESIGKASIDTLVECFEQYWANIYGGVNSELPWNSSYRNTITEKLNVVLADGIGMAEVKTFEQIISVEICKNTMFDMFKGELSYLWSKYDRRPLLPPSIDSAIDFYSFSRDEDELECTSVSALIGGVISDNKCYTGTTIEEFADSHSPMEIYGYVRKVVKAGFGELSVDHMIETFEEEEWPEEYGGEYSSAWGDDEFKIVKAKLYVAMQECVAMAHVYQCEPAIRIVLDRDALLKILREDFSHTWPQHQVKFRLERENHELLKSEASKGLPNDTISYAIRGACEKYGNVSEGVFNAACFSSAFCKLAGVSGPIDGIVVRSMLNGRADVLFHDKSDAYYTWTPEILLRSADTGKGVSIESLFE